jgi:hypothetical protein
MRHFPARLAIKSGVSSQRSNRVRYTPLVRAILGRVLRLTMRTVSATILAHNVAAKPKAPAGVPWEDEIVVVDSFSANGAADIATALGARVVQMQPARRVT